MLTLRLPHRGDIHTAHHQKMHWVPVARALAAVVMGMDTGTQVPVPSLGTASMSCLEVAGKVTVAEETVEYAAPAPFVVCEGSIGLLLV